MALTSFPLLFVSKNTDIDLLTKFTINILILILLKKEVFSQRTIESIYMSVTLVSHTFIMFRSHAAVPFLKVFLSHVQVTGFFANYFLGDKRQYLYYLGGLFAISYPFCQSLNQTINVTFTLNDLAPFYSTTLVNYFLHSLFFQIHDQEITFYLSLLSKYLKASENKSVAKTNYISQMSHDLRTPLHGILSLVNLLGQTSINQEQESYLKAMNSCGNMILDMIVNILDLSKIEAGKFVPSIEKFSLFEFVQEIFDSLAPLSDSKHNEFLFSFKLHPCSFEVEGDKSHLREILVNVSFFLFFFFFFFSFFFFYQNLFLTY